MLNLEKGRILMEYGLGTLEQFGEFITSKGNGWTEGQLLYVLNKMIEQYSILKHHKFYHRDIKPANTIITAEGDIKFIDFGFAIKKEGDGPRLLDVKGTPYFAHPIIKTELVNETYNSIIYDPALTDFYSVCISVISLILDSNQTLYNFPYLNRILIKTVIDEKDLRFEFNSLEDISRSIEELKLTEENTGFAELVCEFEVYIKDKLITSNDPEIIQKKVDLCILDGVENLIIKKLTNDDLDLREKLDYTFLLATAQSTRGAYKKAVRTHLECLGMRKIVGSKRQIAESNYHIGVNLLALHQYKDAYEKINEALKIYEAERSNNYFLEKANCYDCLGNISKWCPIENKKPLDFFVEALRLKQQVPNISSRHLAESYYNIGTCLIFEGNLDKAEQYMKQSKDEFSKVLGKDHPYLYKTYLKLGEIQSRRKHYEEAEKLIHLSIERLSNLDPEDPNHHHLAQPYLSLGLICLKKRKFKEAEEHFQNYLILLKKGRNEASPKFANCYIQLSELYSEMARKHDSDPELFEFYTLESLQQLALDMREKALEIYEKLFDEPNGRVAVCLSHIARLSIDADKDFEYVYITFIDSLSIFSKIPDFQARNIARTLKSFGEYLQPVDKFEAAICYYLAYLINYKYRGEEDSYTLELKNLLSNLKANPEELCEDQLIILPGASEFNGEEQKKLIFEEISKIFEDDEACKVLSDLLKRI